MAYTNNSYKDQFNKLLSTVKNADNILQYYDNVTYNIRFYMINEYAQEILSNLRLNGIISNNYNIENIDKIIIAETGKSTNISIDSLKMHTIYANSCNSHIGTTYQLELAIKEINGCQLVNKIAAISKLLGYEGYINQPFHIDVWFSGYTNDTHKPCSIIEEVGVLTYEVMLTEIKTNIELSGTTYNFVCTNTGISSVGKETMVMVDKGHFYTNVGMNLNEFRNALVESLNKSFFEKRSNLRKFFNQDKFIHIRLIDLETDKNLPSPLPDDYISSSLKGQSLEKNMYPENDDNNESSGIQPSQDASLSTIFQDFCLNSTGLKSFQARPVYKIRQIGNAENQQLSEIYVDVLFSKNTYLESFNERFSSNFGKLTFEQLQQKSYETAFNHLTKILSKGLLNRRYDWLFNGKDTNVLQITSSIDKLWYSNIPIWDIVDNQINRPDEYLKEFGKTVVNNILSMPFMQMKNEKVMEEIKNAIKMTNKPLENIRSMSGDKCLYLDDIYYCMSTKMKNDLLTTRNVLEAVDPYSQTNPIPENAGNDSVIIAKTGFNNLYGAGNLVELQFEIFGDPYWIKLCSDECMYDKNYGTVGSLQYFIFKLRTCAEQKTDGSYDLENVVDFTNIYQILESTSIFENGKFIQSIKSVIAPEFLTLGRLEI